jgi:alpha-1,6-mannosyltransferase
VGHKRRISTLLMIIAASAALYAGLAWLYPLADGLLKPRLMWPQQVDGAPLAALAHIGIYIALAALYLLAIYAAGSAARSNPPGLRYLPGLVILGWLLFSFIALFVFPGESADAFDYLFRGRMMTEYALSPLVHTPFEVRDNPFHRYVSWSQWVDAYGPVWEYASAGVSWLVKLFATPVELLVRTNQICDVQPAVCTLLAKYITGYRLFAIACTGVCGGLIWAIVRHQPSIAHLRGVALLIWLWNPLVVTSTAVGAHNDALMLIFVLLAVWLMQRQRWLLGLLALFAAAHVKITALVMLPVFCVWLWRRIGLTRAAGWTTLAAVIALPLSFALYAPLGGWATLPRNLYERTLLSTNSLGELLYLALRDGAGMGRRPAQAVVARVMPIAFALLAAPVLWRFARKDPGGLPGLRGLIGANLAISLLYLFVGSFWFQPWYVMWPVALAALLPDRRRVTVSMAVLSASALCTAVVSGYLRVPAPAILPPWFISALTVALTWLPALVAYTCRRIRLGVPLYVAPRTPTSAP